MNFLGYDFSLGSFMFLGTWHMALGVSHWSQITIREAGNLEEWNEFKLWHPGSSPHFIDPFVIYNVAVRFPSESSDKHINMR